MLGGALAAVAFGAAGGTELTRTTITEILVVLGGSAVIAAAILWARPGPIYGGLTLTLFALLALVTALSLLWSAVPDLTYVEALRTLSYLVVFAAAVAGARLAPKAAPAVVGGVLIGALVPVAWALASRIWPGTIAEDELSNRIGAPFSYWNAVGTVAAIAVPATLWLGSRRTGSAVLRALAYPLLGLSVLAILLTQSRGALAAAGIAAALWLIVVPMRVRSLPVLVLPALAGGAVGAWALSKDAFAKSLQGVEAKEAVAGDFGLLVLLMCLFLLGAGFLVSMVEARGIVPVRAQRRIGVVALAAACLVPFAAFTSVAFSDRGLSGTFDDRVSELTSESEVAPEEGAERVFAASSTRGKYWREAGRVFESRPSVGTGAGTFAVTRLRIRNDQFVSRHAHGFVPQTLADLGILGVAVSTLLLLAWLAAVLRATALLPRRLLLLGSKATLPARRDWDGDRIALVALTLVAVTFGLQSLIDWTWFIPAPAMMALVAGGFVAGRGPAQADRPLRSARPDTARLVAAGGVVIAGLLLAWATWQPEAADRATGDALVLAEEGRLDEAIAKVDDAAAANPLTPDPLLAKASIDTEAGRETEAERALEDAVLSFPGDPLTWERLTGFQLGTLDRPDLALETVRGALYLDPFSVIARQLFLDARARQRELDTLEARRRERR